MRSLVKWPAVLGLVWLLAGNGVAQAQSIAIGVVDEDKIGENYTKYKSAMEAIGKRADEVDQQLRAREMLDAAQGKQFDELIVKNPRTDAEKAELAKLVTAGTDRQARYLGLVGKATKTEAENNEIKATQKMAADNEPAVRRIADDVFNKLKQEQETTGKTLIEAVEKVIRQVAEEKKLALVVRKAAVIWNTGTMDITNDVLKRLNA